MADVKVYKTQDLVLSVKTNYDHAKLKLEEWSSFIDALCVDRDYQKEAIRTAIVYLASGEYASIEDVVRENWSNNEDLHDRYKNIDEYLKSLQLPDILSGIIDLATGTGKSYVIYGIAQIALGIGLVDKVLVLCPSLTIEAGLMEKFQALSGDVRIKATIPENAVFGNPRIVDANVTIVNGDIAVENIHAVYDRTGSSINDSLKSQGERVLVLNDEAHHAYNSSSDSAVKKWKEFLQNPIYGFKYILGFTGTAYVNDQYFNDVIYRYSIRQAIDEHVVKSVDYVAKDESLDLNEKFQKIYDNHSEFVRKYRLIKPLTILVTKDISKARSLKEDLVDFLVDFEKISKEAVESKVLIVTSHKDHKSNLIELKKVDDKDNSVEWIISVSMLTEGWDVKNVFQIVPWEDRAFNSKLLISQVLGRGLRVPEQYKSPQPKVRVFNHAQWSKSIKGLVDEILEIEVRLSSSPLTEGDRSKYHFDLYNVDFSKEEVEIEATKDTETYDYSKGYANLTAQVEQLESETEYEDLSGIVRTKSTIITKQTLTIDEVVEKIVDTFRTRNFEAKIRFPGGTYEQENLPPEDEIRNYVIESMNKVGIKSGVLTEDNAQRIFKGFQTLFRSRGSRVVFKRAVKAPKLLSTHDLVKESIAVGNIKRGATVFYPDDYKEENSDELSDIITDISEDQSLPRSASKEVNHYLFKTPVNIVLTKQEPERKFTELLVSQKMSEKLDAWVKSRDQNFYGIEYSWRKGEHTTQNSFNPDYFLKFGNNIVVVEIKADDDDSDENKAKYKWAQVHFDNLNEELSKSGIEQRYFFHFLSPNYYTEFAEYVLNDKLFNHEFRSALELKLMA